MSHVDTEDLAMFTASVRAVFAADPREADRGLVELGWRDALREWGPVAVRAVFTEQGRACTTSSALDDVLAGALGLPDGSAVLLPAIGAEATSTTPSGAALRGIAGARARETGAVASVVDGRLVRVDLADAQLRDVRGLDPRAGLVEVTAEVRSATDVGAADWSAALAAGRIALAFELVGLAHAMLDQARAHALARVQFGQPIAGFQAVRHHLVDAYVAVEAAEGAAAAAAADHGSDVAGIHAAMAKALAGTCARDVTRGCQQVLAGIGFTAEHGFHRWLRRALLLDELLGSARTLTRDIGAAAVAQRRVPFDLPL